MKNKSFLGNFKRKGWLLAAAISAVLGSATYAANFDVTQNTDDGTGGTSSSLSWAILQANSAGGADTITLNTDVTISGVVTLPCKVMRQYARLVEMTNFANDLLNLALSPLKT